MASGYAAGDILRDSPFAHGYRTLRQVARRRRDEGDLLGALAALRRAAELAEQRRDRLWRALLLHQMAGLYRAEGAPELAQPLDDEAFACFMRGQELSGAPWMFVAPTAAMGLPFGMGLSSHDPLSFRLAASRHLLAAIGACQKGFSAVAWTRALAAATSGALAISTGALAQDPDLPAGAPPAARSSCDPHRLAAEPPAGALAVDTSTACPLVGTSAAVPASGPSTATDQPRPDPVGTPIRSSGEESGAAPPTASGGSSSPTAAAAALTAPRPPAGHTRFLNVPRVETPPVIDGRLDDACWKHAALANGFWVSETEHAPTEPTEAFVAADATTLYFAFRCHAAHPSAIFAQQKQRDADLGLDDMVTVQLDPYHNHRQISEFTVNALGTQADAMAGGRAHKIEWKGDWKAAAVWTADGWTAEMAIPFAILNYTPGADTFGVNFVRYDHRTQEWSRWADVTPALREEEMGHLTGLRPPARSAPPLSLMTYTTGGVNEPNRSGRRRPFLASSGLDLRYNPTNNLTGMASLYPDFSQVEDEVVDVGFSYNEKFVPDRRPFFQEGSDFFGDSRTYFHSGRIPDFDAGGKLFGRVGPMQVGFLGITAPGGRQDYVARALRELGPRSSLSLMAVGTERSGLSNQLLAFQANTRSARGYTASLDLASTHTRGTPGDGALLGLSVGRETPYLQVGLSANRTGPHFFPGDGFIAGDQLGTMGESAYASYNREYAGRSLHTVRGDLVYSNRDTLSGLLQNRNLTADVSVETHAQQQFTLSYSAGPYRPRGTDLGLWSKTINQDRLLTASLFFNTRSSHGGYGLTYAWGRQGGGPYSDLAPSFWWKPSANTSLSYSYEQAFSFGTTRQGVLSFSCDLDRQQSIGLRWVDYQGQGYWRVAFRRAVARGIDVYAVFNREPGISHRFVVKLVRALR